MSGRARLLIVAALVGALVLSALASAGLAGSGRSSLTLVAEFIDVGPVVPGNDVQVDGVRAGGIKSVKLHQGRARLKFSVGAAFTPVHADATVRLRPVNLLGEQFVDLDRGSPTAPPLRDGALIPISRTGRAVELAELLNTFDQPTAAALAALIVGLGEGLDGHGVDAAATLAALKPALEQTDALLEILNGQNQLLGDLIDKTEPVTTALAADQGQRLDALVAAAGELLRATAAARPGLDSGLRLLPGTLDRAQGALAEVRALAGEAVPLLASLRPVTGDLRRISEELGGLADAARPALASLDPVLDRAGELVAAGRPVAADLAPAGGDLQATARSARTLVEALPPDLQRALDAVSYVGSAFSQHDSIGQYVRGYFQFNQESSPIMATAGPIPARAGTGTTPAVPGPPAGTPAPAPRPAVPPSVAPPAAPPDRGSATGLTFEQERNLLRFFLGVG